MCTNQTDEETSSECDEENKVGARAYAAYMDGDYVTASRLFQLLLRAGNLLYVEYYADICHRNLDGAGHTRTEAAYWYVVAGNICQGEICSYIYAMDPSLLDETIPLKARVELLRDLWKEQYISYQNELNNERMANAN